MQWPLWQLGPLCASASSHSNIFLMHQHLTTLLIHIRRHTFKAAWNTVRKRLSMKCNQELCKQIGFCCALLLSATETEDLHPSENRHKVLL